MSGDSVSGTARAQVPARLIDLSLGGALLDLKTALDVGAIHDFALQLDNDVVWVQGEVKRCAPAAGSGHQLGIEFIGIDPADQRLLQTYVGRTPRG